MREFERAMPWLEPPYGGLERLRQEVEQQDRTPGLRLRQHAPWLSMAALALLALALTLPGYLASRRQAHALVQSVRTMMATDLAPGTIRVNNGDAIALPSGRGDVRLYLVATTAKPSP